MESRQPSAHDLEVLSRQLGRPVRDVAREATGLSEKELRSLLDPAKLAKGGIHGKPGGGDYMALTAAV